MERGRSRWRARLAPDFGIDERSLAALRISLGTLLLLDLWIRTDHFSALYTDGGVFPIAMLDPWMRETLLPFHLWSGSFAWQAALFCLAALSALALLLGWKTRVATVACFALTASLHSRNLLVLNLGDDVLRMALFWCMFLPLGRRASLDARGRPPPAGPMRVLSPGTAGFVLQVLFVYFFAGIAKSGRDWWTGTALHYALSIDVLTTPLAASLRDVPGLVPIATWGTLWLELVGSLLLLARNPWLRGGAAALLASMHLGIAATFRLGVFPFVDVATLLVFVPGAVWDRLGVGRREATAPAPPPGRRQRAQAWVVGVVLAYLTVWNLHSVTPLGFPSWLETAGNWLRINQRWWMFAPEVRRTDRWLRIHAVLSDGTVVDLSPWGPEPTWTRPEPGRAAGAPFRWAIFLDKAGVPANGVVRRRLARWHCREWRRRQPHGPEALRIEIHEVLEHTLPPGRGERLEHRELTRIDCRPRAPRPPPGA